MADKSGLEALAVIERLPEVDEYILSGAEMIRRDLINAETALKYYRDVRRVAKHRAHKLLRFTLSRRNWTPDELERAMRG